MELGKKHGVAKLPPHRALVARVVTPVVMDVAMVDVIQLAVDVMVTARVAAVLDVTHLARAVAMVVVTLLVTQVVLVIAWAAPMDVKLHAQHDALDAVAHAQVVAVAAMVAVVVVRDAVVLVMGAVLSVMEAALLAVVWHVTQDALTALVVTQVVLVVVLVAPMDAERRALNGATDAVIHAPINVVPRVCVQVATHLKVRLVHLNQRVHNVALTI